MGKIIPHILWKIKFMFETTNQIAYVTMDLPMKHGDYPSGGLQGNPGGPIVCHLCRTRNCENPEWCLVAAFLSGLAYLAVYIYNNNTYIYIGKHAVVKPSFGGKNPRWVTKRWYLDAASRGAPNVTPHSTCKIHVTHWVVEMLRSNTSHQLKVQVPDLTKEMIIKKKNNRLEDV